MKNKLIAIGVRGDMRCYLNMSREEAVWRAAKEWEITEKEAEDMIVEEFEFENEFNVYDVWPNT